MTAVYRDPSWGILSKIAALGVLLFIVWFNVPSSVFYKPINMAVIKTPDNHWIAIAERELPFGAVTGKTHAFIQVLGREDGQECQDVMEGIFAPRPNNITRYDVTHWAAECLDQGPPISVRYSRTVYLGGFIPLRPVHFTFTINPDNVPVIENG